jgi:MtN3 and saliva related transmembrane protein
LIESHIVDFIEFMFGLSMFFNALIFIPQAIKIYKTKNAGGLSLATFIGFNVIQVFIILHGYIREDYVLMFGYALSLAISGIVTSLIVLYK